MINQNNTKTNNMWQLWTMPGIIGWTNPRRVQGPEYLQLLSSSHGPSVLAYPQSLHYGTWLPSIHLEHGGKERVGWKKWKPGGGEVGCREG